MNWDSAAMNWDSAAMNWDSAAMNWHSATIKLDSVAKTVTVQQLIGIVPYQTGIVQQ